MDTNEEWRWIPGYEGRYEVSNLGNVRSWRTHKSNGIIPHAMNPKPWPTGYVLVKLRNEAGAKAVTVHRCVLTAFVGPCPDGYLTRHLDGNRTNNRLTNLTWGTPAENSADMIRHGNDRRSTTTHCAKGHEFTPENTRWTSGQRIRRFCRTCDAMRGLGPSSHPNFVPNPKRTWAYRKVHWN